MDGSYAFSLSEQALLESRLSSGDELDQPELDSYKRLSADDKVYNQVLRYVALRPRSIGEVETYLYRKKVNPETIENVISRLIKIGMLDDEKVAAAFVHDRQLLRPTSARKLKLELQKKRIANDIVQAVLQQDTVAGDDVALRAVIEKKRRQTRYQDDQKLMEYLARQGFGYSDIKQALQVDTADNE